MFSKLQTMNKVAVRAYSNVPASQAPQALKKWTNNVALQEFVQNYVDIMKPERLHICDGGEEEKKMMVNDMVRVGTLVPLDQNKRPGCYLARSDPGDVARVESTTFICSEEEINAGPTNNWKDPNEMKAIMSTLYNGCMEGRTMYVVPHTMGPVGSELSENGVEITDSPYVVQSMKIMTRMGQATTDSIGSNGDFVRGIHTIGSPITQKTQADDPWPSSTTKYITHYPEERLIQSYGSGYGGNALLGKKCFALRIASAMARDNGWLAEHMLILGITNPEGKKKYMAAALPSACGKTNMAMLRSQLPGWKIECVGDDIAWMRYVDGKLHAINPEAGFFGVAPGTGMSTNPVACEITMKDTIFTNVAMTEDNDVWWEGLTKKAPTRLTDWLRREWYADSSDRPAAHPNSRFASPAENCPTLDPDWENPNGVPIDAIIFGGRRSKSMPLVVQSRDWQHGTFMGATMGSEQTAAAEGQVGAFRSDPFAMLPFMGYHVGEYIQHWLNVGNASTEDKLPKIFGVNWFKKNDEGKFIWPGFSDNARVLKWIFERTEGEAAGVDAPIGTIPDLSKGALDLSGLDISEADMEELFHFDKSGWLGEIDTFKNTLDSFNTGNKLPKEMLDELEEVTKRVKAL